MSYQSVHAIIHDLQVMNRFLSLYLKNTRSIHQFIHNNHEYCSSMRWRGRHNLKNLIQGDVNLPIFNPESIVDKAFTWRNTKEGEEYWRDVYNVVSKLWHDFYRQLSKDLK